MGSGTAGPIERQRPGSPRNGSADLSIPTERRPPRDDHARDAFDKSRLPTEGTIGPIRHMRTLRPRLDGDRPRRQTPTEIVDRQACDVIADAEIDRHTGDYGVADHQGRWCWREGRRARGLGRVRDVRRVRLRWCRWNRARTGGGDHKYCRASGCGETGNTHEARTNGELIL